MIEYHGHLEMMTMTCDICGDSSEFDGDWGQCIADAKGEGWLIMKQGTSWEHYCPECKDQTD